MATTLTSSYKYIGRTSCKSQNGGGSYYLILHAKTSPNTITGYHTVSIKGILASNYGSFYGYGSTSTGKINGTQVYNNSKKPNSAWSGKNALSSTLGGGTAFSQSFTLGEASLEVDCTNGSAKDIAIQAYYKFTGDGETFTPNKNAEMTVNGTVTLSAINRKPTVSAADNFTDEGNPTMTFSNPLGNNADKLEVCIAIQDSDGTWRSDAVPYREVGKTATSYTFNLTTAERDALRAKCPNSNSLSVAFYAQTTVGTNTFRHSLAKTMTITNANPTMTITTTEENEKIKSLLGSQAGSVIVQGASKIKVVAAPSAKKSATVKTISLTCGNATVKDPANNTYTFNNATGSAISYSVTDSRTNNTSGSKSFEPINYVPISVNSCEFKRKGLDATTNVVLNADISCFTGSIGDIENEFTLTYSSSGGVSGTLARDQYTLGDNQLSINNVDLGSLIAEDAVDTFTLTISDKCMDVTHSNSVILLVPTFEAGQYDFQVNGTLYLANKAGKDAKSLLDYVYPVGSIYISATNSKSPAEIYGGDWTRLNDVFLYAGKDGDTTYGPGKTGGAKTVTLKVAEIPGHTHTRGTMDITGEIETRPMNTSDNNPLLGCTGAFSLTKETWSGSHDCFQKVSVADKQINHAVLKASNSWSGATSSTGGGGAHENMPPFKSVYMWQRTK